ncbi:hypothetical protein [Vulcanisaeta sp. JCM 16161]|uniref:hypothetical protein n=1 Tax=Vulcanisaeta sp. JCM 16161 TaxID=1295372 RepID=UPI000AE990D7|nr:hypothetical protein [Vulcanisaeta sp. JCM 16161]
MFNTTEVYVVAHSLVPGGRHYEKGLKELFAEAFLKVLDQVGNANLGAIYVANAFSEVLQDQSVLGAYLADYVGLRRIPAIRIESGDGRVESRYWRLITWLGRAFTTASRLLVLRKCMT